MQVEPRNAASILMLSIVMPASGVLANAVARVSAEKSTSTGCLRQRGRPVLLS